MPAWLIAWCRLRRIEKNSTGLSCCSANAGYRCPTCAQAQRALKLNFDVCVVGHPRSMLQVESGASMAAVAAFMAGKITVSHSQ
jgi:recombinational DNA repair protein RecR